MPRPRRSLLYLPAANARAIDKALALPCDGIILDLEDSVAPEDKATARRQAVAAVAAGGFGDREVVVRCNGLDTPWGGEDLQALAAVRPDAVLAPKIGDPQAARAYAQRLPAGAGLWLMIETCAGVLNLPSIAATADEARLGALVVGTNDLVREMNCRPDAARTPLLPALAMIVTAARTHGLAALDGVFNALEDAEGFAAQCRQARDFGFDGKTLIHPRQIEPCHQAFTPGGDEVAWARKVVAAFAAAPQAGVLRLEGRMVERLHLTQAEQLLALAAAGQ